ncbi:GNAT family acetyltransferase [Luteolibacter yonseiensis]|uniref:GNAT family acetyltransferase n=1 Tax=Luteolibacter yonseiensis TaxID=1144680 RepID=UPI001F37EEAF|nr:GNAT family acetyltransferase [Luteolibacter yonseiensis]
MRPYTETDEAAVIALWNACGLVVPQNDPKKDIARKMAEHPELFIVGEIAGAVVASCMAGYEGHRGWINYLAVHPDHQRQGYATELMAEARRLLDALGCPKISLQIRNTNTSVIAFYEKLGFVEDPVRSFGLRLRHDAPL